MTSSEVIGGEAGVTSTIPFSIILVVGIQLLLVVVIMS